MFCLFHKHGTPSTRRRERECCLLVLIPVTSTPQWIRQYETQGWWYVPAEEVLGRTCKSCNAFCELVDFTGNKRKKTVPVMCYKCKDDRTGTQSGCGKVKTAPRKRTVLTPGGSTLRRSERAQGQERVNYHECLESETRSDSDDDGSDGRPFYGLKLRAVESQWILDISPITTTATGEIYSLLWHR